MGSAIQKMRAEANDKLKFTTAYRGRQAHRRAAGDANAFHRRRPDRNVRILRSAADYNARRGLLRLCHRWTA